MYSLARPQVEKTNKVATKYRIKPALKTERPAPSNESINLKGGRKSATLNIAPTFPSKYSPNVAPNKIARSANTTLCN